MNNKISNLIFKSMLLSIMYFNFSCNSVNYGMMNNDTEVSDVSVDHSLHEEREPQKVIFFLSIEGAYDIYADCRDIYESDFFSEEDNIHFVPINISRSVMADMGERGLSYLKEEIVNEVSRDIGYNWDRNRDSFYFCGYRLGALGILDAVIDLRNDINIEKVALISPPLRGYEALQAGKGYGYHNPRGPIALLLKTYGEKVQTKSLFRDLLPDSDYLTRLRSYLSSLSGDNDHKVYIASASVKNLCDADNMPEYVAIEVENLFDRTAKEIRTIFHKGSAPEISELQPWANYLKYGDRQQFYEFIRYMYNGQDHDGFYSINSQEVPEINNENISRGRFDGYSGGGHIGLLKFLYVDFPYLFNAEDNALANPKLQKSVVSYLLQGLVRSANSDEEKVDDDSSSEEKSEM